LKFCGLSSVFTSRTLFPLRPRVEPKFWHGHALFVPKGQSEISQTRSVWFTAQNKIRPERTVEHFDSSVPIVLSGRKLLFDFNQPLRSWLISGVAPRHFPAPADGTKIKLRKQEGRNQNFPDFLPS